MGGGRIPQATTVGDFLGDGAVLRWRRFLHQWISQAGVVAKTGRGCVLPKLPAGEYYQRFSAALARMAAL